MSVCGWSDEKEVNEGMEVDRQLDGDQGCHSTKVEGIIKKKCHALAEWKEAVSLSFT